jgi:transcriptional regulator with XRE-family HTH domain
MKMLDKIERLIEERGLTQTAVEGMAGLAGNRISRWKGGMGEPTARQALRMARILGVSIEYLVNDEVDDPGSASELSDEERFVLDAMRDYGLSSAEAVRGLAIVAERKALKPTQPTGARHNQGLILDGLSLRATQQPRPRKPEPDGDVVREDITDQVRRRKRGEPDRKKGAG